MSLLNRGEKKKGKRLEAERGKKCGGKIRTQEVIESGRTTCNLPAGYKTDHLGVGPCKFHGGASKIKHGLRSLYARANLSDYIEKAAKLPKPLDLRPELDLCRAHLAKLAENKDVDLKNLVDLSGAVQKLVESIDKRGRMLSMQDMARVVQELAAIVIRHVKDPEILAKIDREWDGVKPPSEAI